MLDTRKYAADCQQTLGRFLDHVPIYGQPNEEQKAAYRETVSLYLIAFGKLPKDLSRTSGGYSYGVLRQQG